LPEQHSVRHLLRAEHANRDGQNERRDISRPCLCVYGTHGVGPWGLAASMVRLGNAEPASIIGAVIDLTAAVGLVIRGKAGEASI